MANPQTKNGYTKIAHEILEQIAQVKLNGTQFRIIMVVWRYTYGFNRKDHGLSETFISKATEIHKKQVQRELKSLIEMNLIHVVEEATFSSPRTIEFNKDYESWGGTKTLPPNEKDTHTGSELVTSPGSELAPQERYIKYNIKDNNDDDISAQGKEKYAEVNADFIQQQNIDQLDADSSDQKIDSNNSVADMDADSIQQKTPVADVGADLTQQDKENPDADSGEESNLRKLEQYYAKKLSRFPGSKDLQIMLEVYEKGYPVDFVIKCIDLGCKRYKKANNGRIDINSFNYFTSLIKDEWEKEKAREAAEKANPSEPAVDITKHTQKKSDYPKRNYSQKQNRFNNFEQRTSKYTKEELEVLFRKNKSN
ncbi:replication protein [Marinisporobacter balticus]|uniref:Phage replication protein O n=1 Tax=Marinisporobacter balticus TaxID=2018667 RepID=A0A4R2L8S0_9FIRM|nr:replication protein [Marinisporobacter balticus]TCO79108.1 phage replication protein O [Marinisporobacter balticus]